MACVGETSVGKYKYQLRPRIFQYHQASNSSIFKDISDSNHFAPTASLIQYALQISRRCPCSRSQLRCCCTKPNFGRCSHPSCCCTCKAHHVRLPDPLFRLKSNTFAATSVKVPSSPKMEELALADKRTQTRPSLPPSATSGCKMNPQDLSAVDWSKLPTLGAMMVLVERATL